MFPRMTLFGRATLKCVPCGLASAVKDVTPEVRCLRCGGLLVPVERETPASQVSVENLERAGAT